MEHIQSSDFVTLEPDIKDDIEYHKIIDCIKLHKRALKLVPVRYLFFSCTYSRHSTPSRVFYGFFFLFYTHNLSSISVDISLINKC